MPRVAHYINQFFGGRGGEEVASAPPEVRSGAVGPGRVIQQILGADGEVCSTLICGDNYFHEQNEAAVAAVQEWLQATRPDLAVVGPAFAAGRYGAACDQVCGVAETLGIPSVSGMHPENPGRIVNPRAYVHLVTKLIVQGWSQAKLNDLLPDRMLVAHPELAIGDPHALPALMGAPVVGP